MFYFRLNGTRIDDESLIDLGNSLSSNSTFESLRCVAIFSYIIKRIWHIFSGGHDKLRLKLRVPVQIFLFFSML